MIRVLIVDDQALIRAGFRMILEARDDIDVVGEAANGRVALDFLDRTTTDVVLMDIRMPELDGVQATREISKRHADVRVIILTTFDLDEYVAQAIRAGASGFLLKDTQPGMLVDAVRVVAAGDALLAPTVTRRLLDRFAASIEPSGPPPGLDVLTDRELEIFKLVAEGRSNLEIAQALVVAETTVKTHVSAVLRKLGLRDRVQAVIAAYDAGLVRPAAT